MRLTDEEVAAKIVRIYFEEIARIGVKRRLTLDEVINTHYYALSRLRCAEKEKSALLRRVLEVEKRLETENPHELVPNLVRTKTVTTVEETKTE
ncbi:MAG: hypothetical protein NTW59_00990 [Candidatus Diapherotrites archaeon]|nr:hypothetical protein [Candidatus Diapherotrites archaeon]